MIIDKLEFSSEKEVAEFVASCERRYLGDVKKACEKAFSGGKIITLCGPTCSGKTTTALILDDEFKKRGKELHTISIDDFYFDREYLIECSRKNGTPLDYDSPATIDIELFAKVVDEIERCDKVKLPKFDFKSGRRVGFEEISITDGDIFLFEGIQAVYPSLTKYLSGHDYTSLFISVEEPLTIGDTVFSPRTLRFMRRLVRDARTRGASAEFTLNIWKSVVENEFKNIYPNLDGVDLRINSMMAYEVSVIKPFVLPLLNSIPNDNEWKADLTELASRFDNIETIDEKYVPDASVFREFIGKRA